MKGHIAVASYKLNKNSYGDKIDQSARKFLKDKMTKLKLEIVSLKRPEHWGGYNVVPYSIEFWQGRDNRLHDRILYKKDNNIWNHVRLSP